MPEYVTKEAVKQAMRSQPRGVLFTEWELDQVPTVDAVPVVHGRWVKDGDWLVCLNCESEINVKNSLGVENRKNYCPNCGAKMYGGINK